jgi:hypothetical protein
VALALAAFADNTGGSIYPSVATLMRRTKASRRGVQKSIAELCRIGVLIAETPRTGGARTTAYRYDLDALRTFASRDISATGAQGAREGRPPCAGGASPATCTRVPRAPDPSLIRQGSVRDPSTRRAPHKDAASPPSPNPKTIAAMVTRDLLGSKHNRVIDLGELAEIAKGRCALLHLPYDSRSVAGPPLAAVTTVCRTRAPTNRARFQSARLRRYDR